MLKMLYIVNLKLIITKNKGEKKMKNSEHYDLEQLQKRLAGKAIKLEDPDEREVFLKIAVSLGQELEKIEPEPEPERLKYFQPQYE